MPSDLKAIASTFGPDWWRPPLFYSHRFALRFELAQGDFWIDRLESAKHRARTIMEAALGGSDDVRIVIARFHDGPTLCGEDRDCFDNALTAYGLPPVPAYEAQSVPASGDDDGSTWLGATEFPRHQIDRVTWAAVASDVGYLPTTPGWVFVVSLSNALIIHPYDDRGMDVVAASPKTLRPLYDGFGDWLLDHDRPRMDDAFKS